MHIKELSKKYENYLNSIFRLCESPIEQQFLKIIIDLFVERSIVFDNDLNSPSILGYIYG